MGYVSKLSDYIRISVTQDNQHELKEIWDQWGIKAKQLFYNNHGDSQYLLDLGIDENLFRAITQYWNLVYSCFTFGKADMVSVVEEYLVLWRCPMIQVYSKADHIPTFMRKLMNIMGIGKLDTKKIVRHSMARRATGQKNALTYEGELGGKNCFYDGKRLIYYRTKQQARVYYVALIRDNGNASPDDMSKWTQKNEIKEESESSQETLKNNFTGIGRGVHRCRDYLMDEAIAQIRDGSRSFTDHEGGIAYPENGVFGNENHPINVIHEEGTEQTNLEGIRTYESGSSLNNWTAEELPFLPHEVVVGNIALEEGKIMKLELAEETKQDLVETIMGIQKFGPKKHEGGFAVARINMRFWGTVGPPWKGITSVSDILSIAAMVSSRRWPLISNYRASGRKRKPDQIIIFKDGVSESQVNQVLIKLLTLASSLTRSGTLKIVVTVGSPDNVLHGTVIDNKVCHPKNNDFYLGTHAGMIGIMRQTHYHVLLDQAGFSADDLQKFLHSWGKFMKIRDASEISSIHGGMYAPGVISAPQLSRLKDKVSNFILVY
ncbi:hypothetical protein CXB51_031181 [Gossypium anomalum]|uniref:Piwi domain-containing protein n=1 Tax=Gossypium anomalum TaxID=47600 RepID=A0A8J5YC55_9ROSI|nr:hypothetical protein CXB51_031181 [Gossypium anomalum]